jgi:excisionase family DNA binding protein
MDAPRPLVGVAWVAQRTGLHRTTVQQAAATGRIPAYRVLSDWRFDPDEIEAWIQAGSNRQLVAVTPGSAPATRAAPTTGRRRGGVPAGVPNPPAPLAVLFPAAAHRGVYDEVPAESPARQAARRRGRNRKAAVSGI